MNDTTQTLLEFILPEWSSFKNDAWTIILSALGVLFLTIWNRKLFGKWLGTFWRKLRSYKSVPRPEVTLLLEWWQSSPFTEVHINEGLDLSIKVSGKVWNFHVRPIFIERIIFGFTLNGVRFPEIEKTIRRSVRYASEEGVGINIQMPLTESDAKKIREANYASIGHINVKVETQIVYTDGKTTGDQWQQREFSLLRK